MKNRSVYEGNNDSGHSAFTCKGEDNCLKSFQSMHERKAQTNTNDQNTTQRITFEGKKKHQDLTNPPPSKEITNTKTFLQCLSDKNEHTSKISFPLLALMATVVLQSTICLFVNIQNFWRSLPWRGRTGKNGTMAFSDIPFTIGRSMSSSGCSFHICSFFNGWLDCKSDDHLHGYGPYAHSTDDSTMVMQAVSFDRISISTSHFTINPLRNYPSAKSQLSWLRIVFEEIDIRLNIPLKRKDRRCVEGHTEKGDATKNKCINSLNIQLNMRALEIDVFPSPLDWCKGIGIQLDINATFDATSARLTGFGLSS